LLLADGELHHVCVTWESSSGDFKVYKDGALSEKKYNVHTGNQITGGGTWVIGQDQDSLGGDFKKSDSFKGILTEVNIWNRVLGSDEIKSFANDCDSLVQGNYKAYSDFNISSATELIKPSCCPLAPLPEE
jgi:CUB/sushi domain-containing protein